MAAKLSKLAARTFRNRSGFSLVEHAGHCRLEKQRSSNPPRIAKVGAAPRKRQCSPANARVVATASKSPQMVAWEKVDSQLSQRGIIKMMLMFTCPPPRNW